MRATLKFPSLPRDHSSFIRIVELCDQAEVAVLALAIKAKCIEAQVEVDLPWQPDQDGEAESLIADAIGYAEQYSVLVCSVGVEDWRKDR
jgi:predicted RNase H-related nuclease YkuK (DUF458 family)